MDREELSVILKNHLHWLYKNCIDRENMRADLSRIDLRGEDLRGVNLRHAELSYANLSGANLYGANLSGAVLCGADLSNADMSCTNLSFANLSYTNLSCTDLSGTDLHRANLYSAILSDTNLYCTNLYCTNLHDTNLCDAKNVPFIPYACPDFGMFIGYKKANGKIVELQIPEDAKYNNLITVSNYSDSQIDIMSRDYGTYLYEMNNNTYQSMTAMISLVNQFKQIFLYVGIGTGALAAVLLANFISASINNKKKDIGILRAVGAKSGDVFKVFWSESGIIALICFLLASVAAGVVCAVLNNVFTGINIGTIAGIKILNFNIVNIGIILAVAILISILATLFPVLRAAKKPPVEAIRSL